LWDAPSKVRKTRKSLKESVDAAFDPAAVKACLNRINGNAIDKPVLDKYGSSINVMVSEEDLKKALRIGSRGGYTNGNGMTIPAQLVDLLSLEIAKGEEDDDAIGYICLQLYGENEETGETTNDYNNGDAAFVGDVSIPGEPIESDEEFFEYLENNIFPIADRIARDIITNTWNELGLNDYAGITDYTPTDYTSTDTTSVDSGIPDDWRDLLDQADKLLAELIEASGNADYDDGDGYWQTEYTDWCFRYLYHNSMLNNVAELERLCNEYSTKLPNVEFYFYVYEDGDDEVSEIGYTAKKA
jgi:hypothetical protein